MSRPIGWVMPEETKKKISLANKGHPVSEKNRQLYSQLFTGKKVSEVVRSRISQTLKGHSVSEETKKKISVSLTGRTLRKGFKLSEEHRRKLSEAHKRNVLAGTHPAWRGGVTPIHKAIRGTIENKLWREAVFARDNWTCQECGQRGGKLNADHIKPFSIYPELRFELSNGRTLCVDCHRKTPTWGINAIYAS